MFITKDQIAYLKQVEQDPEIAMVIGVDIEYYFLTHGGAGVCGMPAILVGMRKGIEGPDGVFFVDIAIKTPVEGFFMQLESVEVLTLKNERKDGSPAPVAVGNASELEAIIKIVNGQNSSHLSLVPPTQ